VRGLGWLLVQAVCMSLFSGFSGLIYPRLLPASFTIPPASNPLITVLRVSVLSIIAVFLPHASE
jgi:hypothetical protein